MANEEHLARLKQGGEAWNQWRAENPTISPELSRANFREADLNGADLIWADLSEANLIWAQTTSEHYRSSSLLVTEILERYTPYLSSREPA
jgi:hypothetical protein